MGRYRARDLLLPPNLVSLTRVPLAAAFPLSMHEPVAALTVLALAGGSDVLDGWLARRHGQVTATGSVVDPVTDKLFVLVVVGTLVVTERLPFPEVLLLATREIGELPLVAWWITSQARRRARSRNPMANIPGKLATVLQFSTIAAGLFSSALVRPLLLATGAAGALAAFVYARRELASAREADRT